MRDILDGGAKGGQLSERSASPDVIAIGLVLRSFASLRMTAFSFSFWFLFLFCDGTVGGGGSKKHRQDAGATECGKK